MNSPQTVLVYLTGSLGDTLAAVPGLWAIREHWPEAEVAVLSDAQIGASRITPQGILGGAGSADEFWHYPVRPGTRWPWSRLRSAFALWRVVRRAEPDVLVYLIRAFGGDPRVRRDLAFFRLAGVPSVVGITGLPKRPVVKPGEKLPRLPRLADLYLQQLADDGIKVPPSGRGRVDLALNGADHQAVQNWKSSQPADGGRRWIGLGVGSNMPAKIWPVERFEDLVNRLVADYDVWPVLFGGAEDAASAANLVTRWGRGMVAAGQLSVRAAAAALAQCRLYVGNDTGTMHLAAAAGIPCVALFSARDYPGLWEPYGQGHIVLRHDVPCSGCRLEVCNRNLECLTGISVEQVYRACVEVLGRSERTIEV